NRFRSTSTPPQNTIIAKHKTSRFLTDFSFETGNLFPGSPVWITINYGSRVNNDRPNIPYL
ncbi:MAG: hypothetical protein ACKPA7_31650, partial [Sphaerospermopsis kisseleviana]